MISNQPGNWVLRPGILPMKLFVVGLIVILPGCASTYETPGANSQSLNPERYCQKVWDTYSYNKRSSAAADAYYSDCMRSVAGQTPSYPECFSSCNYKQQECNLRCNGVDSCMRGCAAESNYCKNDCFIRR